MFSLELVCSTVCQLLPCSWGTTLIDKSHKKMICFFLHLRCSAVWGLPAFSLDQTHSIKTLFISLRAKRGSHSTLLRVHEEVNTLPRWGWIEQSDAHIIQATVQTDWQLLGKTSHVSAWDRGRARERETETEKEGIVGGGGDALGDFASVLCAAIVHQSLLEAKSVRTEQRFLRDLRLSAGMPERKLKPKAGSDGWTDTLVFHCHTFTMPSGQEHSERLHYLTSNLSCIREKVQINSWHWYKPRYGFLNTLWLHCTVY